MTSSISSSAPKLNIIVIGGGLIGPRHASSINTLPSAHLLAFIDPVSHGPLTASSLGTQHFPTLDALLNSTTTAKPDAAIICAPNKTHVPIAPELIAAGIHCLVEKPISTSIPEGLELIAAAREKGVKVLVGHHRRFNPYLLAAKKALDENSLGQIVALQGTWCLRKAASYFNDVGEWRRGESGGTILINLVHEVDLLQYLLGPITPVILKFQSGVVGTFVLSDAAPSPWNFEGGTGENPIIPRVEENFGACGFYRIMSTRGSLSVPDLTKWTGDWDQVLKREQLDVEKEIVPFNEQMSHFVRVVRDGERPRCTAEEALSALVVCEAIKEAMRAEMWVDVQDFVVRLRDNGNE
ncbi:hypothetical protein VTL71DRAFT_3172 [Oculimacula yallundae]|uniref:Uncharacterized protein n=1 Tax=Oculimacula yallundae TaxID=86028 RepID=A0ABR4C786_9HELO